MTNWGCTLNKVAIAWQDSSILTNVNLCIKPRSEKGNMIPILGMSNHGKSSLLYTMALLKRPSDGEVCWKFPDSDTSFVWGKQSEYGSNLSDFKAAKLRRKYFGFAFQDSTLLQQLTVKENLVYPLILKGLPLGKAYSRVEKVLLRVLLDDERDEIQNILSRYPASVSGGQRQRIALAQAIIHKPTVVFADEPTGSLDVVTRKQIMDVLFNWVKDGKGKRCLVWVTHHPDDPAMAGLEYIWLVRKHSKTCEVSSYTKWLEEIHHRTKQVDR